MIEFDDSELMASDFTDETLIRIQNILGPAVKDALLLPKAVVINVPPIDKS